jgi:hypothetical protein
VAKNRQFGFIDRYVAAVIAMALVGSLAMAAETGRKAAASVQIEDSIDPPIYVLPDARIVPFADMLLQN